LNTAILGGATGTIPSASFGDIAPGASNSVTVTLRHQREFQEPERWKNLPELMQGVRSEAASAPRFHNVTRTLRQAAG
jgi:hypothetical protein